MPLTWCSWPLFAWYQILGDVSHKGIAVILASMQAISDTHLKSEARFNGMAQSSLCKTLHRYRP